MMTKGGTTSWRGYRLRVFDPATGFPCLTMTSATAGLSIGYTRTGSARVAISLSDLGAVNSAFASGGLIHIGGGEYRLDLPDLAIAAGVDEVTIDAAMTAFTAVAPPVRLLGYDPTAELTAARLAFLDAAISSRGTGTALDAAGVRAALGMGGATMDARIPGVLQTKAEADAAHALLATAAALALAQADLDEIQTHLPAGVVASSTEVVAIQNNTRVVRVVPSVIERPDAGTTTYRIELLLYDETGNMEAPDSPPTIALVNQSGTDLSARLDSATMALVSPGRYRAIYTASLADDLEQLVWAFSVVEGGATRVYGNTTIVVDTTAVDFTAADRVVLGQAATAVALSSVSTAVQPTALRAALGMGAANLDTQLSGAATALAAVQTDVDELQARLPSDPADASVVAGQIAAAQAALAALIAALNNLSAAQVWSGMPGSAANRIADHVLRRTQDNAQASADGDPIVDGASLWGVGQQHRRANTTDNPGFLTILSPDGSELEQLPLTTTTAVDEVTGVG